MIHLITLKIDTELNEDHLFPPFKEMCIDHFQNFEFQISGPSKSFSYSHPTKPLKAHNSDTLRYGDDRIEEDKKGEKQLNLSQPKSAQGEKNGN